MRCSSFEVRLDEYVDGLLAPAQQASVRDHVESCPDCTALLEELRVIDALLLAPRRAEPVPNLTFRIMAEVRALPVHRRRHASLVSVLGTYLAFAWGLLFVWFTFGGATARASFALVCDTVRAYAGGLGALVNATAHLFGHATLGVTAALLGVLALDIVIAAATLGVYMFVRPYLAARLAPSPEVLL